MKRGALALFTIALSSVSLAGACGGGDTHEAPDFGAPCSASVACPSGLQCLPTADGTGYCTTTCNPAACPTGTSCNSAFGASVCFDACTTDSECHATQQCWGGSCQPACGDDSACGGSGASCVSGRCQGPECTASSGCSAAQTCVGGHCVAATDGGGMSLPDGAPCAHSSDCTSGLCLPPDRGGVCTTACTNGDTCFLEPWTSSCGVATIDGHFGTYCVRYMDGLVGNGHACTSDAGCENLTCIQGQCRAVCDAQSQCLLGQHCQSVAYPGGGNFMGCGYDPGPASGTEVRTVDLGTFSVASMFGTPQIVFATPPETISVTLRARQIGGDPLDMYFDRVADAGGEIFSLAAFGMYVDQTIRWYPYDATSAVAMQIPNTTPDNASTHNYTYRPGFMQFDMAAYAPMGSSGGTVSMHVDALEVVAATPPITGSLHLRVHLVGVGVTAAAAPTNSRVMAFQSRFAAIMGMVGVSILDVSYVDINAPALAIIDTADGESSELSQLFRMSTGTTENVLNLFLVQEVRAGDSGEFNTLGIAGGIPGPPRIHGSSHSGVVIAFSTGAVGAGNAGGDLAGHVAAHEAGHFMGLFHTTEMGRPCSAGEIPSATNMCAPFGGTDVIGDTNRGDTSNLMHYVVMGSNWNLTAGQRFVELRNPLTH